MRLGKEGPAADIISRADSEYILKMESMRFDEKFLMRGVRESGVKDGAKL